MTFTPDKPIDYSSIPHHCRDGLRLYIEQHHPTGGFLYAVLSGDMDYAAVKADSINQSHLRDYKRLLEDQAPAACWGSPEKVQAWLHGIGSK